MVNLWLYSNIILLSTTYSLLKTLSKLLLEDSFALCNLWVKMPVVHRCDL